MIPTESQLFSITKDIIVNKVAKIGIFLSFHFHT